MNDSQTEEVTDDYHHPTYGLCVLDYPFIKPFKFSAWNWTTHKWDKLMDDPRLSKEP